MNNTVTYILGTMLFTFKVTWKETGLSESDESSGNLSFHYRVRYKKIDATWYSFKVGLDNIAKISIL